MKSIDIPVVPFGSAAWPAGDAGLDFPQMPQVEVFSMPAPPANASPQEVAAAADVVEQLLQGLRSWQFGSRHQPTLSLGGMQPGALRALNESLGQGDVSAVVRDSAGTVRLAIQETSFTGVWRAQRSGPEGTISADWIEAGDMPLALRAAAVDGASPLLAIGEMRPGVMNAPPLLHEIRHHALNYVPGRPAHVINLSHLPLNDEDHLAIDEAVGQGRVGILSRGFGNCRIGSTNVRGVWRVQFFNTMNTPILDTIEIVDIPEAARASEEDLRDSVARLGELLEWLREA